MIYVQLVNYIDLASSSMLNLYDYAYDNNMLLNGNIVVLDLQKRKLRDYFCYRMTENISKYSTLKSIVFDTCIPKMNWRHEGFPLRSAGLKYVVSPDDKDNVIVSGVGLESLLNDCWQELSKSCQASFVRFDKIDSIDVKHLIANYIGKDFVSSYHPDYKALTDNNQQLHIKEKQFPKWIVDQIKIEMERLRI